MIARASGVEPDVPAGLTPVFHAGAHDQGSWCVAEADRQGWDGASSTSLPSGLRTVTPASSSTASTE